PGAARHALGRARNRRAQGALSAPRAVPRAHRVAETDQGRVRSEGSPQSREDLHAWRCGVTQELLMKRWLILLLLTACGPRAGASSANSAANGACWRVTPLRLDALEHGSEWEPMVWLEADGSVHHGKSKGAYASVANDRVNMGDEDLSCAADHTVTASKGA